MSSKNSSFQCDEQSKKELAEWIRGACRGAEISELRAALTAAQSGKPRIVLISGEAGLGKTRLLREIRPTLEDRATVLHGRCYEGSTIPYLPFIEAIRDVAERHPEAIKALEPRDAETARYLFALSVAHVRAGRKAEGIKWATAARSLALQFGQHDLAAAIERDLALLK